MKKILLALSAFAIASASQAALFHFEGNIAYHNDVVYTYFTVDQDATDIDIWTDSFQGGTNFDPITALWSADGTLISQNDDNSGIRPGQTRFDSGIALPTLAAGDYIFTIATYNNFATSTNLADGFGFDGQTAIALADWNQPANSTNMGSYWSLWLDGVDSAVTANVPEPATLALFGLGLAGLGASRRRKAA